MLDKGTNQAVEIAASLGAAMSTSAILEWLSHVADLLQVSAAIAGMGILVHRRYLRQSNGDRNPSSTHAPTDPE